MTATSPRAILIAGPTASGKSALALALARRLGGRVINADSQQVYRDWRVLTARPSAAEEAAAPHALYGHVALDRDYSVGHWLREAAPLVTAEGAPLPIVTGGTGLYFMALTAGLAEIPPTPAEVRAEGARRLAADGLGALVAALRRDDPATAAETDLANPRRVLRAWEVLTATGRGLAAWRAETGPPLLPLRHTLAVALTPDRAWLYARCEARFERMLAGGALDEARAVLALDLPPDAPGLKAVGAAALFAHLRGEISLDAAAARAKQETRRYAKRQLTWIRNQMTGWTAMDPAAQSIEAMTGAILARLAPTEDRE